MDTAGVFANVFILSACTGLVLHYGIQWLRHRLDLLVGPIRSPSATPTA